MRKDVTNFVACFLSFKKVKVEYLRPDGLLQRLPILEWKWEWTTMDFVTIFLILLMVLVVFWLSLIN